MLPALACQSPRWAGVPPVPVSHPLSHGVYRKEKYDTYRSTTEDDDLTPVMQPMRRLSLQGPISRLPAELLGVIFGCFYSEPNSQAGIPVPDGDEENGYFARRRNLRLLCLVSRAFNAEASRWLYRGVDISTATSLWLLVRALSARSDLGAQVRVATIVTGVQDGVLLPLLLRFVPRLVRLNLDCREHDPAYAVVGARVLRDLGFGGVGSGGRTPARLTAAKRRSSRRLRGTAAAGEDVGNSSDSSSDSTTSSSGSDNHHDDGRMTIRERRSMAKAAAAITTTGLSQLRELRTLSLRSVKSLRNEVLEQLLRSPTLARMELRDGLVKPLRLPDRFANVTILALRNIEIKMDELVPLIGAMPKLRRLRIRAATCQNLRWKFKTQFGALDRSAVLRSSRMYNFNLALQKLAGSLKDFMLELRGTLSVIHWIYLLGPKRRLTCLAGMRRLTQMHVPEAVFFKRMQPVMNRREDVANDFVNHMATYGLGTEAAAAEEPEELSPGAVGPGDDADVPADLVRFGLPAGLEGLELYDQRAAYFEHVEPAQQVLRAHAHALSLHALAYGLGLTDRDVALPIVANMDFEEQESMEGEMAADPGEEEEDDDDRKPIETLGRMRLPDKVQRILYFLPWYKDPPDFMDRSSLKQLILQARRGLVGWGENIGVDFTFETSAGLVNVPCPECSLTPIQRGEARGIALATE